MKLFNTLKTLITEAADKSEVCQAVNGRNVTSIYYSGDMTLNPGYRTIEPVAAGLTKLKGNVPGNPVLRAWQTAGATDRPNKTPGWKFFRLDRISNWEPLVDTFDEVRPNFNPNGDKSMHGQPWCIAKF